MWRANLASAFDLIEKAIAVRSADALQIAPSCSLIHTPVDVDGETKLDPELKGWMAFAKQKLAEIATLATAGANGKQATETAFWRATRPSRAVMPRCASTNRRWPNALQRCLRGISRAVARSRIDARSSDRRYRCRCFRPQRLVPSRKRRRCARRAPHKWAVDCFRLSAGGVADETQIHTHMCYCEFNDIMQSIAALDADVISIETSRSHMELLESFSDFKYPNEIGPGVYDIHSPRCPTTADMINLLSKAKKYLAAGQIWVNPDCGLKTRRWDEVKPALENMVRAAQDMRRA